MNSSPLEKQAKNKSKKPPGKAKTGKAVAEKGSTKEPPINDAKFRGDGLKFKCKLIGSADVNGPRGDEMCLDAIKKLKLKALKLHKESKEHKQKITLQVTLQGIRILDEKTQRVEHVHAINKVSFITHDPEDKKIFGYVCSLPSATGHKLFAIKSEKFIAPVVTAHLFELFQVVFRLRQQAGSARNTPALPRPTPPAPDPGVTESVYEEVDKDNSKANTGPEGDEEAQYEELGPAFGHVSQANQNASSSPKDQGTVEHVGSPSSVSSARSDSFGSSSNAGPIFNSSVPEAESPTMGSEISRSATQSSSNFSTAFASSEGFAAAFDSPQFSSDPFGPNVSAEDEKNEAGNEKPGFPEASFEAAFDTTAFAPDPWGDQTSKSANQGSQSADQPEHFSVSFESAFESDAFASGFPKDEEPADAEDTSGQVDDSKSLQSGSATFATEFSPTKPDDGLPHSNAENPGSTQEPTQAEPGRFEVNFDTTPSPAEEAAGSQDAPKVIDEDASSQPSGFKESFSDTFEPTGPIGSDVKDISGEIGDQTRKEPANFQVSFDSVSFEADPFGPTLDGKEESPEETQDESTSASAHFPTAGFTGDEFTTATSTNEETDTTAPEPKPEATAFNTDAFAPSNSEAKDGNEAEDAADEETPDPPEFQAAFGTATFSEDPFGSSAFMENEAAEETSGKFKVSFDTVQFDSFMPNDSEAQTNAQATGEKSSQLFEANFGANFEAAQFPDEKPESGGSSQGKPAPFNSPWGEAFDTEQMKGSAFDDVFSGDFNGASHTVAAPSAEDTNGHNTTVPSPIPVLTSSPASSLEASPSKVAASLDPFGSLQDELADSSTEREVSSGSTGSKNDAAVMEKDQETPLEHDMDAEQTGRASADDTQGHSNLKRPSQLTITEEGQGTQRPVSPSRPPPLPPRVVAAPPIPARPRSISNLSASSLGDLASPGFPGSTTTPVRQSNTPKKTPPPPPPRVDLESKNGFEGDRAKSMSFGSGAFTAVFNGTDTPSEPSNSSWAAQWPSETNTTEDTKAVSITSANKPADPFSEDFFTNFDTPQQRAKKTLVEKSQDFDDPFASKDSSAAAAAFGQTDFFASFPVTDNQTLSSKDNETDSFASSSLFPSNDPFGEGSDPFAEKGALDGDPFSAQKSSQPEALKLSSEDPFASDLADSFA